MLNIRKKKESRVCTDQRKTRLLQLFNSLYEVIIDPYKDNYVNNLLKEISYNIKNIDRSTYKSFRFPLKKSPAYSTLTKLLKQLSVSLGIAGDFCYAFFILNWHDGHQQSTQSPADHIAHNSKPGSFGFLILPQKQTIGDDLYDQYQHFHNDQGKLPISILSWPRTTQ